jgi:hypothetical protein
VPGHPVPQTKREPEITRADAPVETLNYSRLLPFAMR